jgi:mono/diheme cytochrome c family protein
MRNRSPVVLAIIGGIFVVVVLGGIIFANTRSEWVAPPEAKEQKNPVPANDASIAAGKSIYMDKCVNCHGEKGDGEGSEADMYDVKPADFADPSVARETDGELFWKVTSGRKPMPSFKGKLSEEERWQAIDFIRTFKDAQQAPPHPPK